MGGQCSVVHSGPCGHGHAAIVMLCLERSDGWVVSVMWSTAGLVVMDMTIVVSGAVRWVGGQCNVVHSGHCSHGHAASNVVSGTVTWVVSVMWSTAGIVVMDMPPVMLCQGRSRGWSV